MCAEAVPPCFWTVRRRRLYAGYAALGLACLGYSSVADWQSRHGLLINATGSLPNWAFWLERDRLPTRGDYVFFRVSQTPLITAHFGTKPAVFGKRVYGLPGDVVTRRGRAFFINGEPVATAKRFSRKGEALALGPTGVIPPGHYFVATSHADGFDSRYADIGWVKARQLVGVGRPIL